MNELAAPGVSQGEPTESSNSGEYTKSQIVEAYAIVPELFQAVSVYLQSRPYREVVQLVNSLNQCPKINVTVNG